LAPRMDLVTTKIASLTVGSMRKEPPSTRACWPGFI